MRKTAQMIASEVLTKLASVRAKQYKQYWQLLKRLYGGTDEAVAALTKTRDPYIYHGTREKLLPSIRQQGLHAGPYREHGKGVFWGNLESASNYAKPKIVTPEGFTVVPLGETPAEYLKANPTSEYLEGALLRLKAPWELPKNTRYPNPQKAMRLDLSSGESVNSRAPALVHYLAEENPHLNTLTRRFSDPKNEQRVEKLLEERFSAGYVPKFLDPEERSQIAAKQYYQHLVEPKTPSRRYKAQTYSKLPTGVNLINLVRGRPEFFMKDTVVSPSLLTTVLGRGV